MGLEQLKQHPAFISGNDRPAIFLTRVIAVQRMVEEYYYVVATSVVGLTQGCTEKGDLPVPLAGSLGVVETHATVEDNEAGPTLLKRVIIVAEIPSILFQGL